MDIGIFFLDGPPPNMGGFAFGFHLGGFKKDKSPKGMFVSANNSKSFSRLLFGFRGTWSGDIATEP